MQKAIHIQVRSVWEALVLLITLIKKKMIKFKDNSYCLALQIALKGGLFVGMLT